MLQKILSFADVHQVLDTWPPSAKHHRYSLDHMFALLEHLGNPHKRLRVIHVAGTSGKTSTAYYIAALLQATGKRVGLTVSPHVDEVNERVQINLMPLPEAQFVPRFREFLELVAGTGVTPNYFELFIAFAFWEFAARKVDYAVVEVGIGGLLDSTNVFTSPDKVCVITDIGYDHMRVLGNTLPQIAEQKAGIIQLHNAVFCYQQGKSVHDAIAKAAQQKQADLHTLTSQDTGFDLGFLPLFEQRNFGLALAAATFVQERDGLRPFNPDTILQAAHTHIPARMELIQLGDKTLVLDAAHNPQKMAALVASLQDRFGNTPVAALFLLPPSKEPSPRTRNTLTELANGAQHIMVTSDGEDAAFTPIIAQTLRKDSAVTFEFVANPERAFAALRQRPEPVLLATGFRLLNYVRPLLRG